MARPWKGKWSTSWFMSPRVSTYSTNNPNENDLSFGIETGLFQIKHSSLHFERKTILKEKVAVTTVSPYGTWIKLGSGFVLMLLFLGIIYLRSEWKGISSTQEQSYFSIIFDCGSTGTRVHVYEWSHDKGKGGENFPIVIHSRSEESAENSSQQNGHEYPMMQTEPGLDKYLHNESGLRASLEPLLHWVEHQVPSYAHKRTPVFLLATAGLRRLPVSDTEWILDKIWAILALSPFKCEKSWVRVISGVEEAYYGWVALNYEMDKLHNVPGKATFGAIDLGGSSVEVTFESGKEDKGEYAVHLSIGSMERHLYAYSLPAYGLNDAFEKSVVLLYKRHSERNSNETSAASSQLQLKHPCLHSGYKNPYYCPKCYTLNPAVSPQNGGTSTGNGNFLLEFELVGEPNWVECQALARSTVNFSSWSDSTVAMNCDRYPCALHKHQPAPHGSFYALSGFYFVYKFFNLTSTATYDEILDKGRHFCTQTWQDASRSRVRQPFVEQYCFRAPYVVALLRDGLHLRDKQVIIGSGSLTWTLGAALLEAANLLSSAEGLEGQHQSMSHIINIGNFNLDVVTCTIMLFMLLTLGIFIVSCIGKSNVWSWSKHQLPFFRPITASSCALSKVPLSSGSRIHNSISNGSITD